MEGRFLDFDLLLKLLYNFNLFLFFEEKKTISLNLNDSISLNNWSMSKIVILNNEKNQLK